MEVAGRDSQIRSATGKPCWTRHELPKSPVTALLIQVVKKCHGPRCRFHRSARAWVPSQMPGGQMISAGCPGRAHSTIVMMAGTTMGSASAASNRTIGRVHQAIEPPYSP